MLHCNRNLIISIFIVVDVSLSLLNYSVLLRLEAQLIDGPSWDANFFRSHSPAVVVPLLPFHSSCYLLSRWSIEYQLWLIHQLVHGRWSGLDCRRHSIPLRKITLICCSSSQNINITGSLQLFSSLSVPIHLLISLSLQAQSSFGYSSTQLHARTLIATKPISQSKQAHTPFLETSMLPSTADANDNTDGIMIRVLSYKCEVKSHIR